MKGKVTLWPLVGAVYLIVAGGPFGLEDIVGSSGYLGAILILLITPLIWSLPTALMVSELSSAIPEDGGYYRWVTRGMGRFWGFQEGWLSLTGSIFDMAIYPTLFVSYLSRFAPALVAGHRGILIGVVMIAACAVWNMLGACAVGRSSLGLVMIAGTSRGICSVRFGESEAALIEELRGSFPAATIKAGGDDFGAWAIAVVKRIDDPRSALDLPLDIRGTAFQQRVWQALREIPAGSTRSYAELAVRVGSPAAVRAVGTACGANPVAVLVPCHRAVRSDGALSGYRWGVERKRQLLEKEQLSDSPGLS